MPTWLNEILPILLLLVAVGVVVSRLPKVDLGHEPSFVRRRRWNWVVLGLTYAFLYFGRYNLAAIVDVLERDGLLTKAQFGDIDGVGQLVYGIAFLVNGPLTDRWGGRATILISAGGSALMNAGVAILMSQHTATSTAGAPQEAEGFVQGLLVLNAANMYFQSFGAVSIVKVNAHWFHVRERGVLGGLFGILISLGVYFGYDWPPRLLKAAGYVAPFWVPAVVLGLAFVVAWIVVRDSPSHAGARDFDTGDATSGQLHPDPLRVVVKKLFAQRIVLILVAIEFCSGFLRQAVMKWFKTYSRGVGDTDDLVFRNWGMMLCIAGILGGVFAGTISDHVFGSRRGPVASILFAGLTLGAIGAYLFVGDAGLAWSVLFMMLCVIGVHGMLSGTASADFGGTKNAGVVTGIIDGFVYLGGALQAVLYGRVLPVGDAAKDASNWKVWPLCMVPVAVLGLLLCTRVWNARPKPGGGH